MQAAGRVAGWFCVLLAHVRWYCLGAIPVLQGPAVMQAAGQGHRVFVSGAGCSWGLVVGVRGCFADIALMVWWSHTGPSLSPPTWKQAAATYVLGGRWHTQQLTCELYCLTHPLDRRRQGGCPGVDGALTDSLRK